tara:strand:+ start:986 stop:1951 length:966 start_codon:yes stop_codon:yes gene_type:complete
MKYAHQITYWGKEKQEQLETKHAVVVGLGSLGSIVADLLVRTGIKKLTIIDHDIVEIHNLQRQSLYNQNDINKLKVEVAKHKLQLINSQTEIQSHAIHLDEYNKNFLQADIVFDCTDNAETRAVINNYCHKKIPWIYCSIAGSKAMILPFNQDFCFHCIFGYQGLSCDTEGILNTTAYVAGSLQVSEGIKVLLNQSQNKLLHLDTWKNTLEKIKPKRNENCSFCSGETKIEEKEFNYFIHKCPSQNRFIIKPNQRIQLDLEKIKNEFDVLEEKSVLLIISINNKEVIANQHGEIIVRNCDDESVAKEIAERIFHAKAIPNS